MPTLTLYEAIILGLVEGLTEYLPISSTGHLIIAAAMLGLDEPTERKNAVDAFTIVIQGGAILAVLGLYRVRVLQMLRGLLGRDRPGRRLAINLLIAFAPAPVLALLPLLLFGETLDYWIQSRLFYPVPVTAALALGGLLLLILGPWQRRFFHGDEHRDPEDAHSFVDIEHLTWRRALLIGVMQCVAMWPGTSRSMMTIVGGMLVGMRPRQAAEFSFLLGLPTLGSACVYKAVRSLAGDGPSMFETLGVLPLLLGVVVATISAALAIRWLVGFLGRHGLALFGWYRIGLSAVLVILLANGMLRIEPSSVPARPAAAVSPDPAPSP